ncbi:MAG: family transcriptional regulator [Microbacterium sp.]|nr:family transcriptional regulator [Microbacterium sp.]
MDKLETRWNLRQVMASRGLFQTSDLIEPLRQRNIALSREQIYRLVAQTPQRLNLEVLAALCDALDCTPTDLIQVERVSTASRSRATGTAGAPQDLRPPHVSVRKPVA